MAIIRIRLPVGTTRSRFGVDRTIGEVCGTSLRRASRCHPTAFVPLLPAEASMGAVSNGKFVVSTLGDIGLRIMLLFLAAVGGFVFNWTCGRWPIRNQGSTW